MAKPLVLTFGKHKGRAIDEIMIVDPDYFDWLRAQTDLMSKKPELARAFAELGVSGDNTPLHNAIQALFLDDMICERLFRRLVVSPADEAIRATLLRGRRKRLLAPYIGKCESYYSSRERKQVLREKTEASKARAQLKTALQGSDDDLKERVMSVVRESKQFSHRSHYLFYDTSPEAVRKWAAEELDRLAKEIAKLRTELVDMRTKIVEARLEADDLKASEIGVAFKIEHRRFEERNGSDVRLKASLTARAPGRIGARDDVCWRLDCLIEIKPYIADDYPVLLRQLETQKRLAQEFMQYAEGPRYVALVGRYGGQGATIGQVRKMFREAGFQFILLEEIGCEMPQVTLPAAQSVGELPLFGSGAGLPF